MTRGESGRNQLAGETLTRGQNVQQAVDVVVLAGVGAGVVGVLGEDGQTFFCGGGIDAAVLGGQGGVHRQGAGLARFVFDGGGDGAGRVDQFEGGQVTDGGELFEVVGEGHGELQQGGGPVGRAKRALLCPSECRSHCRRQAAVTVSAGTVEPAAIGAATDVAFASLASGKRQVDKAASSPAITWPQCTMSSRPSGSSTRAVRLSTQSPSLQYRMPSMVRISAWWM